MEGHSTGPDYLYDEVNSSSRRQTNRPTVLREAIYGCRKGRSVLVLGVVVAVVDEFPRGALMNKGASLCGAPQQQGNIPTILDRIAGITSALGPVPVLRSCGARGERVRPAGRRPG
jgi:hypothetical protein